MQTLIIIIAKYLIIIIPIILAYYIWTHDNKKKAFIETITISIIAFTAWIIANIFKNILKIPRPDIVSQVLVKNESLYSFPSGHTTFFFAVATVLYFYHPRMAYAIGLLGIAVGLSRVYVGIHRPVDILGGMALGVIVGYIGQKVYIKIGK